MRWGGALFYIQKWRANPTQKKKFKLSNFFRKETHQVRIINPSRSRKITQHGNAHLKWIWLYNYDWIIRIFVSVHRLYDLAGPCPTPSHASPDLEHLLAITKVGTKRFGKLILISRILGKRAGVGTFLFPGTGSQMVFWSLWIQKRWCWNSPVCI